MKLLGKRRTLCFVGHIRSESFSALGDEEGNTEVTVMGVSCTGWLLWS